MNQCKKLYFDRKHELKIAFLFFSCVVIWITSAVTIMRDFLLQRPNQEFILYFFLKVKKRLFDPKRTRICIAVTSKLSFFLLNILYFRNTVEPHYGDIARDRSFNKILHGNNNEMILLLDEHVIIEE